MRKILHSEQDKADFIKFVQSKEVLSATQVEFTKVRRKRSLNQNAYLFLCLAIASDKTGHTKEELYDLMIEMFAPVKELEIFGMSLMSKLTSSNFNTLQMSHFLERTRNFLAQNDIQTPDTNDNRLMEIYEYYKNSGLL